MAAFDTLLAPTVEQQHPEHWLRAAISATIPVLGFRGPEAFGDLLTRCEARAVELDDPYGQAIARWLMNMTLATDRELIAQARASTISPTPSPWPRSGWRWTPPSTNPTPPAQAMRDADVAARAYRSAYIRDIARATHGEQELVFGDLGVVVETGHQLIDAPHATDTDSTATGSWRTGGLLRRDRGAVDRALAAAQRFVARQVPGARTTPRRR